MKGIDVSKWQGTIDWAKVKAAGVDFVYIKAAEGDNLVDPMHEINYRGAKAVGLPVGWYHFGHPNQSATADADFLINTIKSVGLGDMPIILDIEVTDNASNIDAWATEFLDCVAAATHHPVGWYSSSWFATTYLQNTMKKYPFSWVAQYSTTAPAVKWMIWQDSQSGHIDGINGNVDIDEGVSSILGTIPEYATYNVVVGAHVFEALAYNNATYILWTALEELKTPHQYKGNGLFIIDGHDVQGIVYQGNTYLPWNSLAPNIKPYRINWAFEI